MSFEAAAAAAQRECHGDALTIRASHSCFLAAVGILKGYDQLVNIVLDETEEYLRDPVDPYKITDKTRRLGLTVVRGTSVLLISPVDVTKEIPNPFVEEKKAVI